MLNLKDIRIEGQFLCYLFENFVSLSILYDHPLHLAIKFVVELSFKGCV